MKIMVTGGCGFIGSNLVRHLIEESDHEVVNLDILTYAGNVHSLADVSSSGRYHFEQVDIRDEAEVSRCFEQHSPDWVLHLAAESHVDRSIEGAEDFIGTNVLGTFQMLQASKAHYEQLDATRRDQFRFLHVSTDEVYGSLGEEGLFTESTAYDPRSPY
ncbi:MAG: dTDP-glucose 4,6-dehydratase, partial [Luteolibacter sp.]